METPTDNFDRLVRAQAIVFTAMAIAPFVFMVIATVIGPIAPPPKNGSQSAFEILRFVMWGYALFTVAAMFAIHRQQTAAIVSEPEFEAKHARLRGRTVVLTALAEGAALMAGVVTLLEGKPLLALPGFLPLLGWIVIGFPSRNRVLAELTGAPDNLNRQYR